MPLHKTADDVNDLHGSEDAPKWTRSPWHVVEYGDGDQLVVCSDVDGNWRICFMATHGGSRASWGKIQAEANLIAAAPDLYQALAGLLHQEEHGDNALDFTDAKAALAKARGETA